MKKTLHTFLYVITTIGGSLAFAQDPPNSVPNPERLQPPGAPGAPPQPPPPPEGPGRRFDPPSANDASPREGHGPLLRRPQYDRPDGTPNEGRRDKPRLGDSLRRDPFGGGSMPTKPQPFLGVVTDPLEPALSAQLGLTEGLGLIVNHVLSDSPAEKAGLQEHDILKQINDQLIADSEQLATLVRHYGKDTEVTLTIVRRGQEQKLTAKIGEHQAPERRLFRPGEFGSFPGASTFDGNLERYQRRMDDWRRDTQDRAGSWRERVPPPRPSADILREVGPGGPDVKVEQDQVRTRWNTSNARIVLKDDTGEIEVTSENGKRTVVAKDAKGETVFNGPIDTEEQRKAVPETFRKKLESVMRMRDERPPDAPQPRSNRPRVDREGGPIAPQPAPPPAPEPPSPRRAPQVQ